MITSIIIVRLVSKEEYGIYQQFLLFCTTTIAFLSFGLTSSLYYFYPTSSQNDKNAYVKQTILMQLIIGSAFVFLFLAIGIPKLEWLNLENLYVYRFQIGLYIFFMIITSIADVLFTVEKNVKMNRFYYPVEKIIRMSLIISFIFFFQDNVALIYALLVLSIIKFIFVVLYLKDYLINRQSISLPTIKTQLIYSIPVAASIILRTLSGKIDKFIINDYVSLNDFAIYSIASISIPALSIFYSSINNVVMPQIAIYCKTGQLSQIASLWNKTVLKNASITIPIVTFCFVMADELIEILFTLKYLQSANIFRIFLMGSLFTMFSRGLVLRGFKKTSTIFNINLVSMIITVSLGFYLIKKYQLYGAAITALIGTSLPILVTIFFDKKLLNISWRKLMEWRKIFQIFVISILSAIIVVSIKYTISNTYLSFVFAGLFYSLSIYYWQNKYDLLLFPNMIKTILSRTKQ